MFEIPQKVRDLNQYFTPRWVADALVQRLLPTLGKKDYVVDPMCGIGRFLEVLPEHISAAGVEIDPDTAESARELTGRQIITGDILEIELPEKPTLFLGNPPFVQDLFETFLGKAYDWMDEGGRVAMILPAYFFQTGHTVARYNERWSISQEMIPRNIYPNLIKPLCWGTFTKDQQRLLFGFALYHETAFVNDLPAELKDCMIEGVSGKWWGLVKEAYEATQTEADVDGGVALQNLYAYIVNRRPTSNPMWKEQVRKICQTHMRRTSRGRYAPKKSAKAKAAA
ncbi:site-specific DNA-methyltransferase (adenine-specific) [Pseudomonas nitritireducens]|uniref:Site-specific DNA-methyltransferase (Adenine-specific) n=1 Tax=Pseudomonas nitroreducens TaxID=46680 RepID=A0A7W7NYJ9_PSENT|nr:class I SAM-dependent methyltransferase [Pseudomonas nitritireducens]MBB4861531.1 site-specific DNA-methyltransferase (adenine-specific) [Pseudomonas nitritireducens]